MRRMAKILLGLLLAAAIACASLVIWQWQNIQTIYTAKTSSAEEIAQKAEASKERQRIVLEENEIPLVPPSLDQLDRLIEGQTSSKELKEELGLNDRTEPPASEETSEGVPPSEETWESMPPEETAETFAEEPRETTAQERVDRCVRELYAYELDLAANLGALKQEAVDEYRALPAEEQTRESAVKIGYRYLSKCYDVEVESDKTVQGILERLREDLEALEADSSIVDTLWEHYCEEKATAKEYYLNKYL